MKEVNFRNPQWKEVASYIAGFLSNLSVVGIGLAIFREDHLYLSLGVALFSLVIGSLIIFIINQKKGE